MSISKDAFLAIEKAFNLHPATLPLFTMIGGNHVFPPRSSTTGSNKTSDTWHIVIKTPSKRDVANFHLSLSHRVSDRWTCAFLCGDSLLTDRAVSVDLYGNQYSRLIEGIKSAVHMWDHPMLLPSILLENYLYRLEKRAHTIDYRVQRIEEAIGFTWGARTVAMAQRNSWLVKLDTTSTMFHLHSTLSQIAMLLTCCQWLNNHTTALAEVVRDMDGHGRLIQDNDSPFTHQQNIDTFCGMAESIQSRFNTLKNRGDQQINLLYNINSQQMSHLARKDTALSFRIAEFGKQDSTSMTTFTFITALFLPGTFIATLFSMSMFDWQPRGSEGTAGSSVNAQGSNVSGKFWIFWAIVIPLTSTTMAFWYFWSRHANKKWLEKLRDSDDAHLASDLAIPEDSISGIRPAQVKSMSEQLAFSNYIGLTSDSEVRSWWKSFQHFDKDVLILPPRRDVEGSFDAGREKHGMTQRK